MGFKERFGVPYGILANKNHPPTNTPAIQHSWKKKQTKNDKIYLIYIGVIIMIRLHAVPAGHPCKSPARQLGPVVYHITAYPGQVSNSSLFLLHNYIWGAYLLHNVICMYIIYKIFQQIAMKTLDTPIRGSNSSIQLSPKTLGSVNENMSTFHLGFARCGCVFQQHPKVHWRMRFPLRWTAKNSDLYCVT